MLMVRDLVKVFPGPVPVLQGVSLDVGEGMFGLLGPNGAGKTTFMKILAGLLEPTSGRVELDGIDILRHPEEVWARLGYLPQDFGFYPNLTGAKMLRYLLELKGVSADGGMEALVMDLLARVNLSAAAHTTLRKYSGGMRQRLGIAQALAGNPRLIIVDEPTSGLDPEERQRFYRLLAELASTRIVLLSTHIVEDVAVLCSRFAVIRGGKLITQTSPGDACRALAGRLFEGSAGGSELARIRQAHCVTQDVLVEGRNRVRIFMPDGIAPDGFEAATPALEDAYMALMKTDSGVLELA
jgi:ABC-2 type transport system ATP-binding protein